MILIHNISTIGLGGDTNLYIIRNEKYGGTSFNQQNGDFLRFNHDLLNLLVKSGTEELLSSEQEIISKFYPDIFQSQEKEIFLIKDEISSPYSIPIVSDGPEFIDLTISNHCNLSCTFCYTSSHNKGDFMNMKDYYHVLDEIKANRVYQVAIGGGEPTLHPQFIEILKSMREEYEIVPNYTTNAINLTPEILKTTADLCGAVAVSYHPHRISYLIKKIKLLKEHNINTTIHVIVDKINLSNLDAIAETLGKLGVDSIAFLLFKPVGRGSHASDQCLTSRDFPTLGNFVKKIFDLSLVYEFNVGFDSCFAPYLRHIPQIKAGTYDTCTGARFSAYIDWKLNVTPCSFQQHETGESLREKSLAEIWWGDYFESFRKKLLKPERSTCQSCSSFLQCMGGCPITPEIVLCEKIKS